MRLTSFAVTGGKEWRAGVVRRNRIVDIAAAAEASGREVAAELNSVRRIIAAGPAVLKELEGICHWALDDGREELAPEIDSVQLGPPIPDPDKFICVGKNYHAHLDELRRNGLLPETPNEPTGFVKLNSAMVGHRSPVARPEGILQLDYEPEMVFVIGKPAYKVSAAEALDYVFGVTVMNDLTAREIQKQEVTSGTRFWTAKNMPGFAPIGPEIVTLDEIGDPYQLTLLCSVNGEERMRVATRDQIFKIPDIIAHFSSRIELLPGDLFSTGAPGGVALGQPNAAELYLKPGDVVEVGYKGQPALSTTIVEHR